MSRSQSLPEDEKEITPPPPHLRFMGEIGDIERAGGSVFIAYNCNVVIQYLKHPAFTETLIGKSLRLYNLWRLQVFPFYQRELQR